MTEPRPVSCWTCRFRRLGGAVFPCACGWWIHAGKADYFREVPARIVDAGCSKHEAGDPIKGNPDGPKK